MIFRQDVPSRYRLPVSPSHRLARSALPRERFRSMAQSGRGERSKSGPHGLVRALVLGPRHGFDDEAFGFFGIAPAGEFHPFAGLEILVVREEVLDLAPRDF